MSLNTAYLALMFVGLGFMFLQPLVKHKRLEHLFFAIFCGSMALAAAQQLSGDSLGPYQYLLGMGACATCNAMWLVSRSLFSGENSISKNHILFAISISALIIIDNGFSMANGLSMVSDNSHAVLDSGLSEVINLLSSTVLVLTCWEALKGIGSKTKEEFWQRVTFLTSVGIGIVLCTVVAKAFFTPEVLVTVYPWLVFISALQVMLVTQGILWWQQHSRLNTSDNQNQNDTELQIEPALILDMKRVLEDEQIFLTQNLKMIDVANKLEVSEYLISRVVRHHFDAPNFNAYINTLRIEHAKTILAKTESENWSILAIALESGFSSLATFNRVFKNQIGHTPSEYRKRIHLSYLESQSESLAH